MARFEYFDSYATYSGSSTSSATESFSVPANGCEECGDPGSETRFETFNNTTGFTKQAVYGFLSASGSSSGSSGDSLGTLTNTVSFSLSRNTATNPTYSCTLNTDTFTSAGTYFLVDISFGGIHANTFRTTGTTTQVITNKETTASNVINEPFSGSFIFSGFSYFPGGSFFSAPLSFGVSTQSTGITLTVSTTLSGYAFCQVIRDAAFLYTLDPWGALSSANSLGFSTQHPRLGPAYWVTTPLSEGTSFSATNTAGTHRLFDIASMQSVQSASASSQYELLCLAGITETWSDNYECPIHATSFTESLSTHYGSSASSSQSGGTLAAWKTYAIAGDGPANQYRRKALNYSYYIDPLAEPSTAQLYSSYALNNSTLALNVSAATNSYDLFVIVSQHSGRNCYTPAYFTGTRPGITGVITGISVTGTRQITASWQSTSAIRFTAKTSTASSDTVSSEVGFVKSSVQSSDYLTITEQMDVHFPPYLRRAGTEFEPVASYGLSAGTYKLASTNSTGGTASQTSSGIVSSTVGSSAYSRPQRKIAYSYASTTASASTANWDGQMTAFSSLYGGIAGYNRSTVSVEEPRGNNNLERLA